MPDPTCPSRIPDPELSLTRSRIPEIIIIVYFRFYCGTVHYGTGTVIVAYDKYIKLGFLVLCVLSGSRQPRETVKNLRTNPDPLGPTKFR